jgi:nitrate reductase NapAB chaperone NapD
MSKFEIKTKKAILYRPLTNDELIDLNPKVKNVLSEIERIKVLMQEALDLEQLVVFSSKSKELTFTDKVEPIAPVSNNYGKIKVEDLQNKGADVISAIVALRDEKVDIMNKAINDFKNIKIQWVDNTTDV